SPGNGREHRGLVMNRAKERLKGGNDTKDSVTLLPCFYFVEVKLNLSVCLSVYLPIHPPIHPFIIRHPSIRPAMSPGPREHIQTLMPSCSCSSHDVVRG
ncbi:unnamed protein product, partial [Tetraodon nigroviridis]